MKQLMIFNGMSVHPNVQSAVSLPYVAKIIGAGWNEGHLNGELCHVISKFGSSPYRNLYWSTKCRM